MKISVVSMRCISRFSTSLVAIARHTSADVFREVTYKLNAFSFRIAGNTRASVIPFVFDTRLPENFTTFRELGKIT